MRYWQKIDKYMLHNFPIAWNMNFALVSIILIVLNLVFYLYGYQNFDTSDDKLTIFYISDEKQSIIFSFLSLIGILLSVLILMRYLSYRPIRDLMPLKKGYFYKNLFLLMTICIGFIMQYFSFVYGNNSAIKSYYPIAKLDSTYFDYQMIKPWIIAMSISDSSDERMNKELNIVNKAYPAPFPLFNTYDNGPLDFNKNPSVQNEMANPKDYTKEGDSIPGYYRIGNNFYLFYKVVKLPTKNGYEELKEEVPLNRLGVIYEYSILNYAFDIQIGSKINSKKYYELQNDIFSRQDSSMLNYYLKQWPVINQTISKNSRLDTSIIQHQLFKREKELENGQLYTTNDIGNIGENLKFYDRKFYDIYTAIRRGYFTVSANDFFLMLIISLFVSLVFILIQSIPIKTLIISVAFTSLLNFLPAIPILFLGNDNLNFFLIVYNSVIFIAFIANLYKGKNKAMLNLFLVPAISSIYLIVALLYSFFTSYIFIVNRPHNEIINSIIRNFRLNTTPILFFIFLASSSIVFFILEKWRATPE